MAPGWTGRMIAGGSLFKNGDIPISPEPSMSAGLAYMEVPGWGCSGRHCPSPILKISLDPSSFLIGTIFPGQLPTLQERI